MTIGRDAKAILRERYSEMLHNASIFESAYGTVSVCNGIPYYRGRETVLVVGFPLDESKASFAARLKPLARRVGADPTVKAVEYWGPVNAASDLLGDEFDCVSRVAPDESNRDVVLNLCNLDLSRLQSYRCVKRALRNDLNVQIAFRATPTGEHRSIYEKFLATHSDVARSERPYLAAWSDVMSKSDSVVVEVRRHTELVGFSILSLFARRYGTYAYGCFDNAVAGTSDLAHYAMIRHCLEAGYSELDLGYGIRPSLLHYKQKWGPVTLCSPPWQISWCRNTVAPASERHNVSLHADQSNAGVHLHV